MYYFTDDCLIGVEQIDEEHRELFRMVAEVRNLLDDEYTDDKYDQICVMLERLERYAEEHFRHEEEYMERIGHPELEQQRQQHLSFSEKIDEMDAIVGGHDQQEFLDELLTFLVRWLYRHIIGSDLMIGKLMTVDTWKRSECVFTDDFLIGIGTMDAEHQELFRVVEEIRKLIADDTCVDKYDRIVELLEELRTDTKVHFTDEEEYMESIRYPGLEAQRVAHELFSARLDEMIQNGINEHQEETLEQVVAFMLEWLITHIQQMDKKIGEYANQ